MWKINFLENGKRKIGAYKKATGVVKTSDGKTRDIDECEAVNFFDRWKNGKIVKPKKLKLIKK
jgi:hypothetical protein